MLSSVSNARKHSISRKDSCWIQSRLLLDVAVPCKVWFDALTRSTLTEKAAKAGQTFFETSVTRLVFAQSEMLVRGSVRFSKLYH